LEKYYGDAVETVMGCTNILKNAVGIVGIIVVIGICIIPIIKLLTLMTVYYLGAAICEPLADEKITKLLGQMGDTFKLFLAIMVSVSAMLIIGIAIIIKISGVGG
jgi:stage III sporulation protein AE